MIRANPVVAALFLLLIATFTVACSGGPDLVLTVDGAAGRKIANSNGCAACHGKNGQGVTAPKWQGLYQSDIPLKGGGEVLADRDYLYRSITDPQAQIHDGFNLKMPKNSLTDDQIELVIAYITELQL